MTAFGLLAAFAPVVRADTIGQSQVFFTDTTYDAFSRDRASATLRTIGDHAYLYVDDQWWSSLAPFQQTFASMHLQALKNEFDSHIYSLETHFWGSEPNPGVDNDPHVTILLEPLKPGSGGYFNPVHLFPHTTANFSNQREMITLTADALGSGVEKSFAGHEFQHLISANQKELLHGISEATWLNEGRSEYAGTFLGYNEPFGGSVLERRAVAHFSNPSDSLTEWPNVSLDYATTALFLEYVAGRYGENMLADTLRSPQSGIESFDAYFAAQGMSERFIDLYRDWVLADYINDPSRGPAYAYANPNLRNFRIQPLQRQGLSDGASVANTAAAKPWEPILLEYLPSGGDTSGKAMRFDVVPGEGGLYNVSLGVFFSDGSFDLIPRGTASGTEPSYVFAKDKAIQKIILLAFDTHRDAAEASSPRSLKISATLLDRSAAQEAWMASHIAEGSLIHRLNEPELYVVSGSYKRYLRPDIIRLYGHLDPATAIAADDASFSRFATSNYIRSVDSQKVYAVWPDGTKHWLHITPAQWNASGRDWNAIFIVNSLEANAYRTGADIIK